MANLGRMDEVIKGTARANKNGTYERSYLQTNTASYGNARVTAKKKKDAHDDNKAY